MGTKRPIERLTRDPSYIRYKIVRKPMHERLVTKMKEAPIDVVHTRQAQIFISYFPFARISPHTIHTPLPFRSQPSSPLGRLLLLQLLELLYLGLPLVVFAALSQKLRLELR